ncbi:uncharacterized protein CIMG_10676 [Coccidioides immitis RS]|uniref:Uncharacterized protein n=1 Tax=Coccidioides immitis (strain RS) TaxID=246410 RepID=A0A0E1RYC1_COCIM|nr:uncharacterized protein CIMG_10676 [Coccidioides immitis RS]EAS35723.2 hypothetical protein CIMG_10676 [Coccidioides immitis RS]
MHANGRVTVERQETLERISKTGDLVVFRGGPSFVTTAKDDGNQDKFETQDRVWSISTISSIPRYHGTQRNLRYSFRQCDGVSLGIYVTGDDLRQGGVVHHANNKTGGWSYERKYTNNLVRSKMLALALKVGTVPLPQGHAQIDHILGDPNMISQDSGFRCRAWAMDAVARLHDAGVVNAPDVSGDGQSV